MRSRIYEACLSHYGSCFLFMLSINYRNSGHVHNIIHIITPLQDVDRFAHAEKYGPDKYRAADFMEQFVRDISGIQFRENKYISAMILKRAERE